MERSAVTQECQNTYMSFDTESNTTDATDTADTTNTPSALVHETAPADDPDRGWMRRVALLLTGQAFSLLGSSIVQYAIWWWIVMQTNSGMGMLLATLFGVMPQAIVSIFGGSWADRHNRKLLIMLPDMVIAAVTIALSLSFAMGWTSLAMIFVVLLIRSAGGGIQTPAVQSFIPDIVPSGKLLRVNSIYGVINSANMIVAPAVAAVLINVVPLWSILLIDVTTAIIGVGFVAMIKAPRSAHRPRPFPVRPRCSRPTTMPPARRSPASAASSPISKRGSSTRGTVRTCAMWCSATR